MSPRRLYSVAEFIVELSQTPDHYTRAQKERTNAQQTTPPSHAYASKTQNAQQPTQPLHSYGFDIVLVACQLCFNAVRMMF